jgi:transcriptional regulator with XRE-family HTH domain
MTQAELAASIRVRRRKTTPSYISRIESGYVDPRASVLRSLSKALKCPVWYFFWQPGEGTPFADAYLSLTPKRKREVRDLVRYLHAH